MKLTAIQEQASNPKLSVWVSASAGTGKTHILIIRFLRLLLAGNNISSILCLTYTKAAAREMKERVFSYLKKWSLCSKQELKQELLNLGEKDDTLLDSKVDLAQTLFGKCLDQMSYVKIQTIHSFCNNLLAQFPLEAGILSDFATLEDNGKLLKQALLNLLENKEHKSLVESYVESIEDTSTFLDTASYGNTKLTDIINSTNLKNVIKNQELCNAVLANLADVLLINKNKSIKDIEQSYTQLPNLNKNLLKIIAFEETVENKTVKTYIENAKKFLAVNEEQRFLHKNLIFKNLITKEGLITKKGVFVKETEKNGLSGVFIEIANTVIDYEKKLKKYQYYYLVKAKIQFAFLVNNEYEELKLKKGLLDHDDMLYKTLALFKKSDDVMPWVFYKLDSFISHIMVDEAQDTNPVQWQIIKYLSSNFFTNLSNNNTVFVVGDIKQSIYSFQGANPDYFNDMFNYFKAEFNKINKELLFLPLNTSFRSSSAITSFTEFFCNKVFSKEIPYYTKEDFTHNCFKKDAKGFVEIWPLLCKTKNEEEDESKDAEKEEIELIIAKQIANKIQHLVRNEGVLPNDIIVLSSQRREEGTRPIFRHLRRFLRARKIPSNTSDRIDLTKSIFVQDMIALASFLSQVYDDYSLACVLKSPIFGLSNQDLFDIQALNKQSSLWNNLQLNKDYQDVKEVIFTLLKETDIFSPYYIFSHLLYKNKAVSRYVARLGESCLEDIELFLNICLEFESNTSSYALDLFLEYLTDSIDTSVKQEENKKVSQVVVSTIHYFKGLEAKYVFLLDQHKKKQNNGFYFVDKKEQSYVFSCNKDIFANNETLNNAFEQDVFYQENEDKRKNYVAITRAINGLYVCSYKLNNLEKQDEQVDFLNCLSENDLVNAGFKEYNQENNFKQEDGFLKSSVFRLENEGTLSNNQAENKPFTENKDTAVEYNLDVSWVNLSLSNTNEENNEDFEKIAFFDEKASEIGVHVHDILNAIANYSKEESLKIVESYLKLLNCSKNIKQDIKKHVLNVIESSFYQKLLGFKLFTESNIVSLFNSNLTLNRTDSFYIKDNNIYIIDYKTSKHGKEQIRQEYKNQLLFYKEKFIEIFPKHNVYCYLFFTLDASVVELK